MKQFHVIFLIIMFGVAYVKAPLDKNSPSSTNSATPLKIGENESDTNSKTPSPNLVSAKSFSSQLSSSSLKASSDEGSVHSIKRINTDDDDEESTHSSNTGLMGEADEGSPRSSKKGLVIEVDEGYGSDNEADDKRKSPSLKRLKSNRSFTGLNNGPKEIPPTGTTTPYKYFAKNVPNIKNKYPTCKFKRVWTLFRHGIRYPGSETIYGMRTRLKNFQEALILQYYESIKLNKKANSCYSQKLKDWVLDEEISGKEDFLILNNEMLNKEPAKEKEGQKEKKGNEITDQKFLTAQGRNEMYQLGKRFREKFGDLLLPSKNIIYKFTKSERTEQSARLFYTGLNDKEPPKNGWYLPFPKKDEKDPILKFDSICDHWRQNYKKGHLNKHSLNTLTYGEDIEKTINKLRKKLGFPPNSVTLSDAKLLYEVCAFEQAWERDSPWCEIFDYEYQKMFEYLEDLELFNNDGPSNLVNKKIGCVLFQDLVKRLIGDVTEDKQHNLVPNLEAEGTADGTFYFSHLTAVLKFITHLGLYQDKYEKLTPFNYADMGKRKWKSSSIGCFGTNLTFVLMECQQNQYFILFLHQERPVRLPKCPQGVDLCPLNTFLEAYKDSISDCRYEEFCNLNRGPYYEQVQQIIGN